MRIREQILNLRMESKRNGSLIYIFIHFKNNQRLNKFIYICQIITANISDVPANQ